MDILPSFYKKPSIPQLILPFMNVMWAGNLPSEHSCAIPLNPAKEKHGRFKVPIFVSLLIFKGDHILLIERKNSNFMDGFYSTVDGKLEEYELPKDCAIRTAKEKLNIIIQPSWLRFSSALYCYDPTEALPQELGLIFNVIHYEGEIVNNAPKKVNALGFFPIDQLPKNIIPSTLHWIHNHLSKVIYAERDWKNKE